MNRFLSIAAATLFALYGSNASADTSHRADWMAGKRGMMVHWLFAEAGQIDYYANAFDINKFMADFDATKSDYLIFTVGQNKGTYASPNAKLAELGIPAGCCATRDLVGEIAAAVHARGKKFIAYLPCEVNQNDTVKTLLGWSDRAEFQEKYCAVITEWAERWGTNLDGWWIDGFYNDDGHWASSKGFDQSVWATALRAGNPNAVVTFNPGLNAQTPRSDVLNGGVLSDYLAGEINSPSAINWTLKEFADDATCRAHFLMPIDGCWGAYWPWSMAGGANPYNDAPNQETMNRLSYVGQFPDPVVSESDLRTMIQNVFAVNGAVTINVGVNASGTLNPASVALLAKMPGGSTSASADPGTTVESLIGSWSSTPMASDGSTFSTDGDFVYAYCTASENKTVNGITFTGLGTTPATASADFEFAPAFNTTQNAESDGMSGDLETIARLAWKNSEKTTKGYATMTFKGLTAGKRYCIQLYIHDTYCRNSAVFGPDAKSTVIYREEENDLKSGQDWTCGGVFTGVITAKGTTHEITLNYPTTDRIELNALQVRCLGDAGEDPGPVAADPDTSWMKGSFGVSFHWTAKIVSNYGSKNWEQAVANFNVKNFADSVESFGAKHVIFTVAHAWQQLPCPCTALDKLITGRTTTRDLMQDIIDELTNRNIRVIFYYNHSCNHGEDAAWQAASGYNNITNEASMADFGTNICSIVRELSLRYGDGVSAWWFDSATSVDDSQPWPNNKKANNVEGLRFPWDDLFDAARAGNPHAAVAVNWDVHAVDQHGLATDYLSGETEKINAYGNFFPFAPEGFQDHIWTRMDSSDWFWQGGDVENYGSRFTEEQLAWWKVSHRDAGRMATLNLVIDEAGNINPVVAQQLVNTKTLGKVWVQGRYNPYTWQPASSNLLVNFTDADGTFIGGRPNVSYQRKHNTTGISVLTDGAIPNSENFYTGDITVEDSKHLFGATNGSVFAWTLKGGSDIYGINIFTRGVRSQYNAQTSGSHDSIVVAKLEVRNGGSSDWTEIEIPAVTVGIGSDDEGVSGGALMAKLVDCTGAPLATAATEVRITLGTLKNGDSIFAEIEVIGCASGEEPPEEPGDDDPEEPEVIPVYTLTIPAKTGLLLDSVKTNSVPVEATENAYSIVSNTEVTITFTAASGYELDGNDGVVTKTIESDYTFGDADFPAVKEPGGGEDPVDPPPGELVNGRANMKGWSMKRVSTPVAAPTISSPQGWSGQSIGDLYKADPTDKYSSLSATDGEITMTFADAVVANTIQLFAPKESVDCMASAFKVFGSNDGSVWTELLSVTGEADWFARECRYYTFNNTAAYTQYKLAISAVNGGSSLKLGVFNYFFTKPADSTTPWTWAGNVLSRDDQSINNVSKKSDCLSIDYNDKNENIYDLDLTAGVVDANGAKIDLPVKLNTRFKGSAYLTRVVAPTGAAQVGSYGLENCYALNEVVLGPDFTTPSEGMFKKTASLQFVDLSAAQAQTLPQLFMNCYNIQGDIVFSNVTHFLCRIQDTRITSIALPSVETLGFADSWVAPFGLNSCLTNITLGANLTTLDGGQIFGKLKTPVSVYWKSAPPTFTYASANLHGESSKNVVTHYLPWSKRAEWQAFAAQDPHPNSFSISLPEDLEGVGYWKGSGSDELVRWWNDEPPTRPMGTVLFIR